MFLRIKSSNPLIDLLNANNIFTKFQKQCQHYGIESIDFKRTTHIELGDAKEGKNRYEENK